MIEFRIDIEMDREAGRRATMLNYMAGLSAMGQQVDLTAEFNTENGTKYTRNQLLTTYKKDFMAFVIARIKLDSERLTERTAKYHANITGYNPILRFTRKENQRLLMYSGFWINSTTQVLPWVFDDKELKIDNKELVNWWQSADDPTAINTTPSIWT